MSTADAPETVESLQDDAERAIKLLKEYTEKLDSINKRVRHIWMLSDDKYGEDAEKARVLRARHQELLDYVTRLRPAATALIQRSSGLAQHARMDEMTRLELRLRLAEFEAALGSASTTAQQFRPR
jgi:hypothetical protein